MKTFHVQTFRIINTADTDDPGETVGVFKLRQQISVLHHNQLCDFYSLMREMFHLLLLLLKSHFNLLTFVLSCASVSCDFDELFRFLLK